MIHFRISYNIYNTLNQICFFKFCLNQNLRHFYIMVFYVSQNIYYHKPIFRRETVILMLETVLWIGYNMIKIIIIIIITLHYHKS